MSVEVRIPDRDAPSVPRVALVAALSLAAGLALAWWGAESERTETRASAPAPSEAVAEEAPTEEAPAEVPEVAEEAPAERADVAVEPPAEEEPAAPEPVAVAPERDATAASSLRLVRGRVAYIRCDGVRGCPRDEALEASVWSILDALPACSTAPTAAGEADIRIDYRGDAVPEVGWRDTFPSDTVRLDRERVLGCVSDALSETRQSLGAEWLRVSFRFALVAR